MKKVIIIGSSGAGKSTFARRLGEMTGLEVIHLDKVFWNPNWVETPKDEWRKTVEKLTHGNSWILDGNYSATIDVRMAACDTVIFLDLSRTLCIYRILKRVFTYRKGKRPDIPDGCDEKFNFEFLTWVWGYPTRSKPKIESFLKQYQGTKTIIRLGSRKEVKKFLDKFSADAIKLS